MKKTDSNVSSVRGFQKITGVNYSKKKHLQTIAIHNGIASELHTFSARATVGVAVAEVNPKVSSSVRGNFKIKFMATRKATSSTRSTRSLARFVFLELILLKLEVQQQADSRLARRVASWA